MTADLAAVLARERDRLAEEWARSLSRLFPTFAHRPAHEQVAVGRLVVRELTRYLQAGDPAVLRLLAADESLVRLLREVGLPDVLRSLMALREQTARLLEQATDDPAAAMRGHTRLVAATDLLLIELTRRDEHLRRQSPAADSGRAYVEQNLAREVQRALRFRRPLALLLVGVDGYEEYTRVYGQTMGEAAAAMVSGILARVTREVDIRIPLEEGTFGAILLETDLKDARWVAERIRTAAEAGQEHERAELLAHLTVSVGLAVLPLHAEGASALLAAADESLLHARRLGGNTVIAIDELRSGEPVP